MRKLIITNIVLLFLCLIILEFILRVFFPVYTVGFIESYYYDDETAYRLKKDLHLFKTLDYQAEIFTNKQGTANFQNDFEDYKTIIYTVGDSFTEGSGLPSDASYPFQLNLILNINDTYKKEYGVINLGVGGYSGKQNLLRLKQYIKKLRKPDFILYLGSENDEEEDFFFNAGMRYNQLIDGNPHWGILVKPVRWLTNNVQIGLRLKIALRRIRIKLNQKKIKKIEQNHLASSQPEKIKIPSVASLQKHNFEELLALSREMDAQLIISWSSMKQGSYDWLKQWAAHNKIAFADWRPMVQSVIKEIPHIPLVNNHQGGHYRTWINHLIAHSFAREIKKLETADSEDKD